MKEKIEYMEAVANTMLVYAPPVMDWGPTQKRYGKSVKVRTEPKVGRNVPCPCGSGLKSKRCCNLKTIEK